VRADLTAVYQFQIVATVGKFQNNARSAEPVYLRVIHCGRSRFEVKRIGETGRPAI